MENYYRSNFIMKKPDYGNFSLDELDNMIPFEKEIYMIFLNQELEEKKREMQKNKR